MHLPRTGFGTRKEQAAYRIFQGRIPLIQAGSYLYFREKGITRQLLHAVKYKGQEKLAFRLGRLYADELRGQAQVPDILLPVPLHRQKKLQRGYNQAESIARGMAAAWGTQVETSWLLKTRHTGSQTRATRTSRWLNVRTRFEARVPAGSEGLHLAVVDDVLTTGATLEACLQTLDAAGCKSLSIFTLAITETGK